jgi:hypothetical protein
MFKSKLDSVIEELVKTAEVAVNKDFRLLQKTADPKITSELARSLVKVAEALKVANLEVTVDEIKESIK